MDPLTTVRGRAEQVRQMVEEYGLAEEEAEFFMDLAEGKTQGDIESDPPLTDEERAQLGLGRSLLDIEPVTAHPKPASARLG